MVGVCMTVLSLLKLLEGNTRSSYIDELIAIDSVIFAMSALLSYASMRFEARGNLLRQLSIRAEKVSDGIFMLGLLLLCVAAIGLGYGFY
jgi:hypothetical protein